MRIFESVLLDNKYLTPYISFTFFICCLLFSACSPQLPQKGARHHVEVGETDRSFLITKYGIFRDESANEFLNSLCDRISEVYTSSASLPLKGTILNTETPIAVSIGTGEVFISKGIIKLLGNEAELSFVIAHELGHDLLGHHRIGSVSSTPEIEADLFGLQVITTAGYPPMASISALIGTYGSERFLNDEEIHSALGNDELLHPSLRERLKILRGSIPDESAYLNKKSMNLGQRDFFAFKNTLGNL